MNEKYMNMAFEEAMKAFEINEIPVGCVIVLNNNVISKGHNLKESLCDATCHAEIIALREAYKYLGDWRLDGCILYTTLEPCDMCMGAIRESRISEVIYAVSRSDFSSYYKKLKISKLDSNTNKCSDILKTFFKRIRM